jgi:guanylate kinase
LHPDAVVIFVMPPSREEQQRRLRARGDPEDKVARRLRKAEEEEPIGLALSDHVVVNDEIDRAVKELQSIIATHTG